MSEQIAPSARLAAPAGVPREEWLALRKKGIGGSDVAAILGLDPNRGPLHVYLDKRGELAERRDARLERAARRGRLLEQLVADLFAEETGHTVTNSPGTFQNVARPWMLANVDFLVAYPSSDGVAGPLECKTRTWRSARREDWGGLEPPDGPALQAHWYMAVTGYRRAWVAALVDDDFVWFCLERDEELIGHLVQIVGEFWHEHVLAGVEPDPGDLESTGELLAHIRDIRPGAVKLVTDPGELADLDGLLAERARLKAQIAEAQRELVAVENRLKAALGDAEAAIAPGRELYSWRRDGAFSVKRFREAMPRLAAQYSHMVRAVDRERLAKERPDVYRRFRARVLRTPGAES